MRVAHIIAFSLAVASSSAALPFIHRKPTVLSLQDSFQVPLFRENEGLDATLEALETLVLAPIACANPSADLPVKGDFPALTFPIDQVSIVDIETKGAAIGNISVAVTDDALIMAAKKSSSPALPEPSPALSSNITFATSVSATTPELMASLMLTPPTLVFDPITGKLTYNLTTPSKFLVPTDCAIVKLTATVPKYVNITDLKVSTAMMSVDILGTAAHSNPDDGMDFESLDVLSVFGHVGIVQTKTATTVQAVSVNGEITSDAIYAGVNVSYLATRGAISLTNSVVNGNVSLTSILGSVYASSVSFNGSFNASSRIGEARAAPITILKDASYPIDTSISIWSVLGAAYVEITDPFDGPFNASAGFASLPVVWDAKGLVTVIPGIYPTKVSGVRGQPNGLDYVNVASKVGGSTLKFIG
ncbi:hypothetical protein M427DRAFT_44133 [Gonapodya prolifera JEL478]|uniref:Adhesin domain-containing protein n=1 Tax=Gonapodya prolifera (strain JEL478) TaxID=1344416 RepID=A0A139AH01_GONPJ|nr:hypothetical protein M427DRAFT_44133 [Gonapodya prolifera JEL478]|eukprot:KXS15969.1 hypothetical protein M427DRAFT_44133 [Gonapodya prolifera JEL478]